MSFAFWYGLLVPLVRGWLLTTCLFLTACMPMVDSPELFQTPPELHKAHFITRDGVILPVYRWWPDEEKPEAVVVAVHGFNDYGHAFVRAGEFLKQQGIALIAYDQRHFGLSPRPGLWPGMAAYVHDLADFTAAIRHQYPGIPVYILGESMGGAVATVMLAGSEAPAVDGVILVAPAVWGRSTMPWYQRGLLTLFTHTAPWLKLTGKGLNIRPSDNIEVLKGLSRDPWVIKGTRVDALSGLADLMDEALASGHRLSNRRVLLLYGERDEIIPKPPMRRFMASLRFAEHVRVGIYAEGYHLLLRDLGAERPLRDVAAWIGNPDRPLPSGADGRAWRE